MSTQENAGPMRPALLPAATAAWFGYLVTDFLIHGVFLSSWWRATESYWLPPKEMFRMIPYSYVSFAIYCAVLTWLLWRLFGDRLSLRLGLQFGALAGLIPGTASALGTYSLFHIPTMALLIWPATQTIISAIVGTVASWVLLAKRPWRRVGLTVLVAVVFFIAGVVIQNLLFPTPADHRA